MKPVRKRPFLTATAAIVTVGLLSFWGLAQRTTTAAAPQPGPVSDSIGIAPGSGLAWESAADMGRDLDAIRAAGASWVRLDVDWSSIEMTRGTQNWSRIDRAVDAAGARNLKVLGIATYAPHWAQDASMPADNTHGRPADAEVFATFAAQAAQHFNGRIGAWEIWNEPNLSSFFAPKVDPAFYTEMLRASYKAVRAAVPDAIVLNGGLAPAADSADGAFMSPLTFIRAMYANGGKDSTDALALHPYSYPELLSAQRADVWAPHVWVRAVHDLMESNGDNDKKIWFTEFGAPSATVSWDGRQVAIDEQKQGEIIADGLAAAHALPYVGMVFLYNARDSKTGSNDIEDNFGLLRSDFTQKPAYTAVQRQAARDVTEKSHSGP